MGTDDYERARALYEAGSYEEALKLYLSLAERTEDPGISSFIGQMYVRGQGVARDEAEGLRWYSRAADSGDARSMVYIAGVHLRRGEFQHARDMLEMAAAQGYGPAFYFLGRIYDLGKGVPRDRARARRNLEIAAEKQYVWARKEIALRMLRGEYGVASIPKGIGALFRAILDGVRIARGDADDERIRV